MKIVFIGCGYVFDIYMRTRWAHPELTICGVFDIDLERLRLVSSHYGFFAYASYEAVLADKQVEAVINLTNVQSHYPVVKAALLGGKHVYSEKPLTTDLRLSRELFAIARQNNLILTGAPCNIFSDAIVTIRKALQDGALGRPVLVYAELDDNPAHLMGLETVRSPTGAPFPFMEEFTEGCTFEHIGYHLVWLCTIFGPVLSVTALSTTLINQKLGPNAPVINTPDFSVACLTFYNGVVARVTCSWVAPRDHQFSIVGDAGAISADNIFHDQARVYLERFSRFSLTARKSYTIRTHPFIGRLFGVGGRRLPLVRQWKSYAVEAERGVGRTWKHRVVSWLRRREIYAQDKLLGIAEMAHARSQGLGQPLPPDFLLHINELTLLVQGAGPEGGVMKPTTTFGPLDIQPRYSKTPINYLRQFRPAFLERFLSKFVEALHRR